MFDPIINVLGVILGICLIVAIGIPVLSFTLTMVIAAIVGGAYIVGAFLVYGWTLLAVIAESVYRRFRALT